MLASTTALLNRNTPVFDWYLMPESYSAPLVNQAIDEFAVPPGATVLDPFCGTATTLRTAMEMGRSAVGVDLSPPPDALTPIQAATPSDDRPAVKRGGRGKRKDHRSDSDGGSQSLYR